MSAFDNVLAVVQQVCPVAKDGQVCATNPAPSDDAFMRAMEAGATGLGYQVMTVETIPGRRAWAITEDALTDTQGHVIYLRPGLTSGERWRTLAHELCHAIHGVVSISHKDRCDLFARELQRMGQQIDRSNPNHERGLQMMALLMPRDAEKILTQEIERAVELAVALTCETVGVPYEAQAHYLANWTDKKPRVLTEVRDQAEQWAAQLVAWLTTPVAGISMLDL